MKTFIWQGSLNGKPASGTIEAPDPAIAFVLLTDQQITHITLKPLKKTRLHTADHYLLLSELCDLFNAKLSLLNALQIVASTHPKLFLICKQLEASLNQGHSFSEALQASRLYNPTIYSLIQIGEKTGQLGSILSKIREQYRQQQAILNTLKKALLYPAFVLIITTMVLLAMLLFIIPKFSKLFQQFHAKLPVFTQLILYLSESLKTQGLLIAGFIVLIFTGMIAAIRYRPALFMDTLLSLPYLKTLVTDSFYARIFCLLHTCLSSGLSLQQALALTSKTITFKRYQQAFAQIMTQLKAGASLSQCLDAGLFPEKIRQWVMIAESAGTLDSSCKTIGDHYSNTLTEKSEKISLLIEPFLMVVLGLGIGSLVVALYLPLFQIGLAL